MIDPAELIHQKRAEYEASQEFKDMVDADTAAHCLEVLIRFGRVSPRGACAAASVYIDENGAGMPECDWWAKESPRQTSLDWAKMASQPELEAFLVSASSELGQSPVAVKAIKRTIVTLFNRMNDDDKKNFVEWASKQ